MKKLISILLLLSLLLLAGCTGSQDSTEPADTGNQQSGTEDAGDTNDEMDFSSYENKVRVLCYNVYYKDVDARSADIQDLILKQDADVLLLQEVSVSWIPYIQSFMADNGYSYYGYGRYGGELSASDLNSGDQFVPILWKTDKYDLVDSGHFWLSSTPDEVKSAAWVDGVVSKYPRCVNWVILKDKQTGGEFLALNIHTDPESDLVRTNSCGLTVQMMETLRDGRPAVIGGDWNMGLTDTGYGIVTSSGYKDCRVATPNADLGGSFNAWGDREEGNFAYGDHIFISEDMAAEEFRVVDDRYDGEHISDHNPLLAVLYY